jgi:NADPH-dependent 2,4-dienoyl-CoA reductase/sulfur reductase-like enzyme
MPSLFVCGCLCLCAPIPAAAQTLVEAETFQDKGGWVLDNQFMALMGSPFLLAHGMGEPVKDASTSVTLPAPGTYKVWARTRDWAPYTATGAPGNGPGRFQVRVDGQQVGPVQGDDGNPAWGWRSVGTVTVASARVQVSLHDETGFEGRCDAILFSDPAAPQPPEALAEQRTWRKRLLGLPDAPKDTGAFDLVVVGGGIAGITAAVQAARLGLRTALIHNRGVLGGNNSSETRVHLEGKINQLPYANLGNLVKELDPGPVDNADVAAKFIDETKRKFVLSEGVSLFLNHQVFKAEVSGGKIAAVVSMNVASDREYRFAAPLFVDCTGDGEVGYLAGADWRMGRESKAETGESLAPDKPDSLSMGYSNLWRSAKQAADNAFPVTPWALQFSTAYQLKLTKSDWDWESGFDRNTITEAEAIRDHNFRAIYGNWSYLKNNLAATYGKDKLEWVSFVAGKRESRRLLGDVILKQQDVLGKAPYPDASFTTTWTLDLHYPEPTNSRYFPGQEFISIATQTAVSPYAVPYRCLYSRNIGNLFMAGRDISVTHVALGTVRVMRTTGMMGEVVGRAAYLANKHATSPRGVYQAHLPELIELLKYNGDKVVGARPDFADAGRQSVFGVEAGRPGGIGLSFRLGTGGPVHLEVRDARGGFVETVVSGRREAGEHRLEWSRGTHGPGLYFFRFRAGAKEETRKGMLL